MNRWSRVTGIQSTIGIVFLMIFIILAALAVSWGLTCLVVYWISLLWAGTVFAFEWSWAFATGVWLALCLIGSFCQAKVNLND
jgi:hypothetical protein